MKRLWILLLCLLVITGCSQNKEVTDVKVEEDLVADEGVTESKDAEVAETVVEEVVDQAASVSDITDLEGLYLFLQEHYFGTLDYEVTESMLGLHNMDINSDGIMDAVVNIDGWNAAFVTLIDDQFELIGTTELAKSFKGVRMEDGFIIFDLVYSGTGTATTVENIYGYKGTEVVLLAQIPVEGYDAGGEILMKAVREGDYRNFYLEESKRTEAGRNIYYKSAMYTFDDASFSYSVSLYSLFDVNNGDMILADVRAGDTFDGFTVSSVEATSDAMGFSLAGNQLVDGRIVSAYDDMYDSYVLNFVTETPLISQTFIHEFSDDLDPEPSIFTISFGAGYYEINNLEEFITQEDMERIHEMGELEVQIDVASLYEGAYYRSEGFPRSLRIQGISSLDSSFEFTTVDSTLDIQDVTIGQIFGGMAVSEVSFNGSELLLALEGQDVVKGELYANYDELNDEVAYFLDSEELDGLVELDIAFTFDSGNTGSITQTSSRILVGELIDQERKDRLMAGEKIMATVVVRGYYEWILDQSEAYAEWLVNVRVIGTLVYI